MRIPQSGDLGRCNGNTEKTLMKGRGVGLRTGAPVAPMILRLMHDEQRVNSDTIADEHQAQSLVHDDDCRIGCGWRRHDHHGRLMTVKSVLMGAQCEPVRGDYFDSSLSARIPTASIVPSDVPSDSSVSIKSMAGRSRFPTSSLNAMGEATKFGKLKWVARSSNVT